LMIETDILFSHIKDKDWLKEDAETILRQVAVGRFGEVQVSREAIHELYYLLARTGHPPADILSKVGSLTRIANLFWTPTTTDHDLLALSLVTTYGLSSIFDSYHAATCLLEDSEHKMVSTDDAYDRIPRITRIDPRKLAAQIREEESKKAKR
jgi:predicted nucleic acid-binding protein